jgi:hypothetical protein
MFSDYLHWTKIICFELIWFAFFFLRNYNLTFLEMHFLFWYDLMIKLELRCWFIKITSLMIVLKNKYLKFLIFVIMLGVYIYNGFPLLYLLLNKFFVILFTKRWRMLLRVFEFLSAWVFGCLRDCDRFLMVLLVNIFHRWIFS